VHSLDQDGTRAGSYLLWRGTIVVVVAEDIVVVVIGTIVVEVVVEFDVVLGVVVGFVGIGASVVGWPVIVYTLACCVQVWWSVVREVLAVKIEGKNFVTSTGMVRLIFAPDPRLCGRWD